MPIIFKVVDFKDTSGTVITNISGGSSFDVEVILDSVTTSDLAVTLSVPSGSPVTVPATLTVPQGSDRGSATVSTSSVTSNQLVQVTASADGGSANASILVMAGIVP